MAARPSGSPRVKSFHLAVDGGDPKEIEEAWNDLESSGEFTTMTCNIMMSRFMSGADKDADAVRRVWDLMGAHGIRRTTPSYNIYIRALVAKGNLNEIYSVLRDMDEDFVVEDFRYARGRRPAPDTAHPNDRTMEAILTFFSVNPRTHIRKFRPTWQAIHKYCGAKGIRMNTRTYNHALAYYNSRRGGVDGQLYTMREMIKHPESMPDTHSLELLAASMKHHHSEEAKRSILKMCVRLISQHNVPPSNRFFAAALLHGRDGFNRNLLSQFEKLMWEDDSYRDDLVFIELLSTERAVASESPDGGVERMLEILELAKSDNALSCSSYNVVLAAISENPKLDTVSHIMMDMMKEKFMMDRYTFNTLLKLCNRLGRGDLSFQVYQKWLGAVESGSIKQGPDIHTYNTLLDSIRQGHSDMDVSTILSKMEEMRIPLSTFTGNMLLQIYWDEGKEEDALRILGDMKEQNVAFDHDTYCTLMEMYRDMNDPARVVYTFCKMLDEIRPSPPAVRYLLDVLRDRGDMCSDWKKTRGYRRMENGSLLRTIEVKPLIEKVMKLPGVEESILEIETREGKLQWRKREQARKWKKRVARREKAQRKW